eukprot:1158703-Pelagomonas_calceolata.AAC.3
MPGKKQGMHWGAQYATSKHGGSPPPTGLKSRLPQVKEPQKGFAAWLDTVRSAKAFILKKSSSSSSSSSRRGMECGGSGCSLKEGGSEIGKSSSVT